MFARGNAAIWPMQLVWYVSAVAMVGLALLADASLDPADLPARRSVPGMGRDRLLRGG